MFNHFATVCCVFVAMSFCIGVRDAEAQIVRDSTLGSMKNQALAGPDFLIPAEMGTTQGSNLFHSFSQFSVSAGESATFTGPDSIANVMCRVTGGSQSYINGLLKSDVSNADFYLTNPAGVIFGPQGRVDVPGAFHVSTADYLRLEDGSRFNTSPLPGEVLTVAPPAAFGFLNHGNGSIGLDEAQLNAANVQEMSFIAGGVDIVNAAQVIVPDGKVNVVAVASPGEVTVAEEGPNTDEFVSMGPVNVGSGSGINVSGNSGGKIYIHGENAAISDSKVFADSEGSGDAGGVFIRLQGELEVKEASWISSDSLSDGNGGQVSIVSNSLSVNNGALLTADAYSAGNGGNINIETGSISMLDRGLISVDAVGSGDGGVIEILADSLYLRGSDIGSSGIVSINRGLGEGGRINIEANAIHIDSGGKIVATTSGPARGGTISITANDNLTLLGPDGPLGFSGIGAQSFSTGNAGDIVITGGNVEVGPNVTIDVRTFSSGNAGSLTMDVGSLTLWVGDAPHGGFISIETDSSGHGGRLQITAEHILLRDNGYIIGAAYEGNGANVTIEAQTLELRNNGSIGTTSSREGHGGDINITVGLLQISDGSSLTALTGGPGFGGDIMVDADTIRIVGESFVTVASSDIAKAGSIDFRASQEITVADQSEISASATEGGDGGNISIESDGLLQIWDGRVTAQTSGDGARIVLGGREGGLADVVLLDNSTIDGRAGGEPVEVVVRSNAFIRSPDSQILTDAPSLPPETDVASALLSLPEGSLESATQLQDICAPLAQQQYSSFEEIGGGGLPARPQHWQVAHVLLNGSGPNEEALAAYHRGSYVNAAKQWQRLIQQTETRGDHIGRLKALINLAAALDQMGMSKRAADYLTKAWEVVDASKQIERQAWVQAALGSLFVSSTRSCRAEPILWRVLDMNVPSTNETCDQRLHQVAADLLRTALATVRAKNEHRTAAVVLNNLGNQASIANEDNNASALYQEAIRFAELAEDHVLATTIQTNFAYSALHSELGDANARYGQALSGVMTLDDSRQKAWLLTTLGSYALDKECLKTTTGIDTGSLLRQALDIAKDVNDARTTSWTSGLLGQWYFEKGQLDQAIDSTWNASKLAQATQAYDLLYRWQWQLGRIYRQLGRHNEALFAYRRAAENLERIRPDAVAAHSKLGMPSYRDAVGGLYYELADLLLEKSGPPTKFPDVNDLKEARESIEQFKAVEIRDYFRDDCLELFSQRTVTETATAFDPNTAVVYIIPLPDRVEFLIDFGGDRIEQKTNITVSEAEIREAAKEFSQSVGEGVRGMRGFEWETKTTDATTVARRLYDWLIKPIEPLLQQRQIDTLVFVPDGVLRTIPMAALYDGEKYLVESYAVAVSPGLSLMEPKALERDNFDLLLCGLSETNKRHPSYGDLPHVKQELNHLEQLFGSRPLLNQDFTEPRIENEMTKQLPRVVHIASHGQFGADSESTFILTWDGRLTLDELEKLIRPAQLKGRPVELLTLSACETAAGDDRAALGLAGIALKAGARSTLATLWAVNDKVTARLIGEFYRQLRDYPKISKAKALQEAQLLILKDQSEDGRKYHHPAYWSPYLIIGNWL